MPPGNQFPGVRDVLLLSLLWPVVCALQQPHSHNAYPSQRQDLEVSSSRWNLPAADSINTAVSEDTHTKKKNERSSSTSNVSALATRSPAEINHPAVRPPPAQKPVSASGLTTRHELARSLRDWQVEDILLLATVDGTIYARDRTTGAEKWRLGNAELGLPDKPIVETTYHAHNKSVDENGGEFEDALWIVEPSQDGNIYMYVPDTGSGIQRLPFTVRQLVEKSPFASPGHPSVEYNAEKRTMLYTIDAATGKILKRSGTMLSMINDDQSCKNINPLQSLDDEECERIGKLRLGRNEYTIGVQDGTTGQQISTIKYSEWVLNNLDVDLQGQHREAMDSKYVYTRHDGSIYGLDVSSAEKYTSLYHSKLDSPVARVFDIVRRLGDDSEDASLVVLPQPLAPSLEGLDGLQDPGNERIFVDCTKDGSWYALSEHNYPAVTDGATRSSWTGGDPWPVPFSTWPNLSERQRKEFAGVHFLDYTVRMPGERRIDAPRDTPGLPTTPQSDAPRIDSKPSKLNNMLSLQYLFAALAVIAVTFAALYPKPLRLFEKQLPVPVADGAARPEVRFAADETITMVRESEPAKETIFPHEGDGGRDSPEEPDNADDDFEKIDSNEATEAETKDMNEAKPKKKATRGKRGGKKQKEKEQLQAEARAKRANSNGTEVISVAASESIQVSGPLQINSLLVHTDKVIGQGSCGTCVFEGSFEGRDVAVKRMLSQYYELASQEVSFLQQSDDHPNVVRYFCQQKDDHFLYIAVELCQASVFEVWEADKARTEARQLQLRTLKHAIQQDVPKALQQLAAGLYHLHNLRIIHRDIKPQNILVAFPKRNQNYGPRLVISDFGLGKNLPENVSTLIDPTGNAGTSGWKAPELISQPRDTESKHSQSNSHTGGSENANGITSGVKRAADIFSLGCLFFWVMTDGIHPYEDENGWQQLRELNIKRNNKKMGVLERWSDAYEPMQLITSMLEHEPENRPNALQVLNHPFFWSPEKRLAFLCDCSDHFEREQRGIVDDGYLGDSKHLRYLEYRAEEVIGAPFDRADFLSKLDRHFVDTLGRQRKYSGNRLLDLLRALRNKKNHYEDMPEDVKKRVGPLAGGYLNYWSTRFPRLLMACYEVVHEIGVQNNDRFKGYFAMEKH